jgi:hypothetical protein
MDKGDERDRIDDKSKRLQTLFPLLTEETQAYLLGLAEGLTVAQETAVERRPYEERR